MPLRATLTTKIRWMVFSCMAGPTAAAAVPVNPRLAHGLDSEGGKSYFALIPIHRLPGGAFVRASAFSLGSGPQASRWARNWVGFSAFVWNFPSANSTPVELKKGREWLVLP